MFEGFVFTIVFLALVYFSRKKVGTNSPGPSAGATSNYNIVTYPSDIRCKNCSSPVSPTMETIDTSTWDLICKECNEIAYEHPDRQKRKEQIDWLLNK
jgi:hypothetical protein